MNPAWMAIFLDAEKDDTCGNLLMVTRPIQRCGISYDCYWPLRCFCCFRHRLGPGWSCQEESAPNRLTDFRYQDRGQVPKREVVEMPRCHWSRCRGWPISTTGSRGVDWAVFSS